MAADTSGSILAADFGTVHTRVVLIDVVDGVYRLIARAKGRTTSGYPVDDVSVGFYRVIQEIQAVTGRTLLNNAGNLVMPERDDRSGVDVFVMTASTGRPLRTVMLGLVPEVSVASAMRAVSGTYVEIVETLNLRDARSEEDQLNALMLSRPDLIFIAGGTEGGAQSPVMEQARLVQLAVMLRQRGRKPIVLYAGNSQLEPQIRDLFEGVTPLFVAPNVRPSLENESVEAAQLQLAQAYNQRHSALGGGFSTLIEYTRLGVMPTAQSYDLIVDYLGKARRQSVLAVDVGSSVSTLSVSVNEHTHTSIRTDAGVGGSAPNLLETVGVEAVQRWLPFYQTDAQIETYVNNKALRPASVPMTVKDLYMETALIRAAVQRIVADARPGWGDVVRGSEAADAPLPFFETIIAGGSALNGTGNRAFDAMLLLDALQPTGVTQLYSDNDGLISALGSLAHVKPEAVVQVLDGNSLERIGVVFNVSGTPKPGRTALKVRIDTGDEVLQHEVEGGSIWAYRLPTGKTAKVDVRVTGGGMKIGGKRRVRGTFTGGSGGLIFDARGRALPLALKVEERAVQMPAWQSQITGDPVREIDARLLVPPAEPDAEEKRGRSRRRRRQQDEAVDVPVPGRTAPATDDDPFADVAEPEESLEDIRDLLS